MEIKRIINVSKDELETLVKAGTILGEIKNEYKPNSTDSLGTETIDILNALKTVIDTLIYRGD